MRALALIIASSVLGLGCGGCPTFEEVREDRTFTGHVTYQAAGAPLMSGDIGSGAYFVVRSDASGTSPSEMDFGFAADQPPSVTTPPSFYRLVVRLAPSGPWEVDLSDENSILTVHLSGAPPPIGLQSVSGHLSILGLDPACGYPCPLHARGTLTMSAAGPDGAMFELSSGTFLARDTVYETQICQD